MQCFDDAEEFSCMFCNMGMLLDEAVNVVDCFDGWKLVQDEILHISSVKGISTGATAPASL